MPVAISAGQALRPARRATGASVEIRRSSASAQPGSPWLGMKSLPASMRGEFAERGKRGATSSESVTPRAYDAIRIGITEDSRGGPSGVSVS